MLKITQDARPGPVLRALVLEEAQDQPPTEEEIKLYASSIGINPSKEPELIPIAKEGISAPLPQDWQVLQDENNQIFYHNTVSGQSLWEHPLDEFYRQRVAEARLLKENAASAKLIHEPSKASSDGSSGSSSTCSTPTEEEVCVTSARQQNEDVSNPASQFKCADNRVSAQPATNVNSSGDHPRRSHWTGVPLLGDAIPENIPVTSRPKNILRPYLERVVESEITTSGLLDSNLHKKLDNAHISVTTQTSETPDNEVTTTSQCWTGKYCADLEEAERRLSELQAKLRESLKDDTKSLLEFSPCFNRFNLPKRSVSLIGSARTRNFTPSLDNVLNGIQKLSLSPRNLKLKGQVSSETKNALTGSTTKKENYPDVINSPLVKDAGLDPFVPLCPKVGLSPSGDNQGGIGDDNSECIYVCSSPPVSRPAGKRSPLKQPVSDVRTVRSPEHLLSDGGELLNQKDAAESVGNLNEGISHLVEERSRLQRKMLRLKLIYKTYKQRLSNLDASLVLLQHSASAIHNAENLTNNRPEKSKRTVPEPVCVLRDRHFLSDLHSSSAESVHPVQASCLSTEHESRIVNVTEIPVSTVHESVRPSRRSLSTPRSNYSHDISRFTSFRMSRHQRSPSQDLAHSLASIDAQLHNVLHRLGSVSDVSFSKPNPDGDSARTPDRPHKLLDYGCSWNTNPRPSSGLVTSHRPRRISAAREPQLSTPVSPEDDHEYQRPCLDLSPTWLCSD
ncbi:unnamed protein product [Calicophoron daubneyi]|uniref:WW domain-containing protein n=1 Tax=Calicophoron daubneyi TaxID=300641 RepID=A0AAV2T162_CALDB